MKVRLWMWYVPGTDEQIGQACEAALQELQARDISVGAAFAATVAANELDESYTEDVTPDVDGVSAWYAAEFAAFSRLSELTGEWPSQGSLIVVEE